MPKTKYLMNNHIMKCTIINNTFNTCKDNFREFNMAVIIRWNGDRALIPFMNICDQVTPKFHGHEIHKYPAMRQRINSN